MLDLLASDNRAFVQDVFAWSVCIAALIWGAGPERAVAIVWLFFFEILGGMVWPHAFEYRYGDIDIFLATIDLFAGFAWIAIALYANRNYPLCIAAMQLLSMTAHLAKGLVETISPIAYAFMVVAPGWFQLAFLALGLTRHIYRKRRYGSYRDWRIVRSPLGSTAGNSNIRSASDWLAKDVNSWRDDLK